MEIYVLRSGYPDLTKLFVGGLHGKEWKVTKPILKKFIMNGMTNAYGKIIIIPKITHNNRSKYISTLKEAYYKTLEGKRLLKLIQKYNPDIYVELHCYRKSAYNVLTDPQRLAKKNVPPLVEIKNGVLIGSVSPHLLSIYHFKLSLVLEVCCKFSAEAEETVLELLKDLGEARSYNEILDRWLRKYPNQINIATKLYYNWFKKYGQTFRI